MVFDDYVKDAEKIFQYLQDPLCFKNIYFVGHSEGSLIAMLASEKEKVKSKRLHQSNQLLERLHREKKRSGNHSAFS